MINAMVTHTHTFYKVYSHDGVRVVVVQYRISFIIKTVACEVNGGECKLREITPTRREVVCLCVLSGLLESHFVLS